jgi:hypothetical protein
MAKMNWERDRRNRGANKEDLTNRPIAGTGGRSIASECSYYQGKLMTLPKNPPGTTSPEERARIERSLQCWRLRGPSLKPRRRRRHAQKAARRAALPMRRRD